MPLSTETKRLIEQNVPLINLSPAQICTQNGNTESGSPITSAPTGKIWVKREGNHMAVPAWNAIAFEGMVGTWVEVGERRSTGEVEVVRVLHDRNVKKFGRTGADGAAQGKTPPPEMARPRHNYTATRAPVATDDSTQGYSTNSLWVNLSTDIAYICVDATAGAAVWRVVLIIAALAQGDLLYASAANTLAALAKNTTATRYIANTGTSNNPAWAQINLTNGVTGALPATNGGTGQSTVTQGDLLYGASNAWSKLAKNTTATRYLSNTGSNNDPAWAQVNLANGVTGTLPFTSVEGNSSGAVNTTDATTTTIQTIATSSNISYMLETTIVARRTGGAAGSAGDSATYKLIAAFKNVAGTLSQIGATDKVAFEDQAGWDGDFAVSGTNILVQGTGAVDNNVSWSSFSTVRSV